MKLIFFLFLLLLTNIEATSRQPHNFLKAKEIATRLILSEMNDYNITAIYSNEIITPNIKLKIYEFPKKPLLSIRLKPSENYYESDKYKKRSLIIEWEHIFAAKWVTLNDKEIYKLWYDGDDKKCVRANGDLYKGRECAEQVSKKFNKITSDLYNLVPSIGALNALRRAYNYGIIPGEERVFGDKIDFEIDTNNDIVEPSENVRGEIARVILYMIDKYDVRTPDHNETIKLMKQWNEEYPETDWEKRKKEILKNTYNYNFED